MAYALCCTLHARLCVIQAPMRVAARRRACAVAAVVTIRTWRCRLRGRQIECREQAPVVRRARARRVPFEDETEERRAEDEQRHDQPDWTTPCNMQRRSVQPPAVAQRALCRQLARCARDQTHGMCLRSKRWLGGPEYSIVYVSLGWASASVGLRRQAQRWSHR